MLKRGRETNTEKGTKGHGTQDEKGAKRKPKRARKDTEQKAKRARNESRKGHDSPKTSSGVLHFFCENPDPAGSRIFRIPDPEFSDPDLRIPNSRIPGSRTGNFQLGGIPNFNQISLNFSLAGSRISAKLGQVSAWRIPVRDPTPDPTLTYRIAIPHRGYR